MTASCAHTRTENLSDAGVYRQHASYGGIAAHLSEMELRFVVADVCAGAGVAARAANAFA